MLALVGPILSKVKLSGAHLRPRLGQVGPMWSMLGTSWAHVEPMLAYVRRMLAYVGLGWAYVGVCWPHVGLCWLYVTFGALKTASRGSGGFVGCMASDRLAVAWPKALRF